MIIFLFYQKLIASDKIFAEILLVLLSKCVYKLAVVEYVIFINTPLLTINISIFIFLC